MRNRQALQKRFDRLSYMHAENNTVIASQVYLKQSDFFVFDEICLTRLGHSYMCNEMRQIFGQALVTTSFCSRIFGGKT